MKHSFRAVCHCKDCTKTKQDLRLMGKDMQQRVDALKAEDRRAQEASPEKQP